MNKRRFNRIRLGCVLFQIAFGSVLFAASGAGSAGSLLYPSLRIPEYTFARFNENRITFPEQDTMAFEGFFSRLDTLLFEGRGHLSILHIGGSHVQAGVFSGQMRNRLVSVCPGIISGRGLIFPFSAGKTNNPASFRTHYSGKWNYERNAKRTHNYVLGLAGAAISTSDADASLGIVTRPSGFMANRPDDTSSVMHWNAFEFNRVTILGYANRNTTVPVMAWADSVLYPEYDVSKDMYVFDLPDYTDSIQISFRYPEGHFTLTGILLDNDMPGITYHGIGVNGARVDSYLQCENLDRDLELIHPDLVIFGIGINDAASGTFRKDQFIENYQSLIRSIRRVSPECALLFITNNDNYQKTRSYYTVNTTSPQVEQAFMELATQHDRAGVWDFFHIMGGLRSMPLWEAEGLAQRDKIHFTSEGYRMIGDLLYSALMDCYMRHLSYLQKEGRP